jgi:hypothetical protein
VPVREYTMRWDSVERSVFVEVWRDGRPATGVGHDEPGLAAAYVREGERAVPMALSAGSLEDHVPGGWAEVDPVLMPGLYRLGVPDDVLARGPARAMVVVRGPGMRIDPVEIELVAYDPLDPVRLGMSSLGPTERLAALRGAFPLLAGKEIEEREARLRESEGHDRDR